MKTKNQKTVTKAKINLDRSIYFNALDNVLIDEVLKMDDEDQLYADLAINDTYLHIPFEKLIPAMEIVYDRFRYREYDYRITLDTNIRVKNLLDPSFPEVQFETSVLEVKTVSRVPRIPLMGFLPLASGSFSKYKTAFNYFNTMKGNTYESISRLA